MLLDLFHDRIGLAASRALIIAIFHDRERCVFGAPAMIG
jgi:hypothetical protein